jgi:hypothetical protein
VGRKRRAKPFESLSFRIERLPSVAELCEKSALSISHCEITFTHRFREESAAALPIVTKAGEKRMLSTRPSRSLKSFFHISQCEILKLVQMFVDKSFSRG